MTEFDATPPDWRPGVITLVAVLPHIQSAVAIRAGAVWDEYREATHFHHLSP